jgi:hypothetical protein
MLWCIEEGSPLAAKHVLLGGLLSAPFSNGLTHLFLAVSWSTWFHLDCLYMYCVDRVHFVSFTLH